MPPRASRSRASTHVVLQPRVLQGQALPPSAPISPWRAGRLLGPARSLAVRMVVALSRRRGRHGRRGGPMARRSAGRWSASRVSFCPRIAGVVLEFGGWRGRGGTAAAGRSRGSQRASRRVVEYRGSLEIDARLRWAPVLLSFLAGSLFSESQSCPRLVGQADDWLPAYRIPGPPPRHELSILRPVFRPPRLPFSMQVNKQNERQHREKKKKKRETALSLFLCAAHFCGGIVAF